MIAYQLQELKQRLDQIKPFYVKARSMPVLNCVRMSPHAIEYSNLDVTLSAPTNGEGEGMFMIPFQILYEYVKSSKASEIIFDEMNGRVTFGDASVKFVMEEYYSPDDFPIISVSDFNTAGAATPQQVQRVFSCFYAAAKDDIRFNLNGICIDVPNKTVVATDGHRLALRKMDFALNAKDKYVIPRFVACGLLKIIKGKSEVVQFSPSEIDKTWIAIRTGDISLYIRGYDKYPDYKAVLPQEGALKLSFTNPKAAIKQLQEIRRLSPKLRVFALKGNESGIVYAANASYKGVMQGCKAYQECFFLVNINYLIDCLKQFEKAEGPVYVRNNKDKTGSWMFSLQNSSDFDLVMPMRGDKEELWFEDVKQDN